MSMPIGYLITVVVIGLLALSCLRPPRRPRWLARFTYFIGVGLNEVPGLFLVAFAASTAAAIIFDGLLETAAGWFVFGAGVLVALVLLYLQLRILTAWKAVTGAVPVPTGARPWGWAWLLPFPRRPASVERIGNIRYAPGGRFHLLDLYRRRDLRSPAPVLIYFHGGGYFSGGKRREGRALLYRMAERGWVTVSANYGLRPAIGFPGHLIDAKRVVAWARENADRYGMNPDVVVMSGSSAGGHMSVLSGLSPNQADFQPGFEDADTRIAAAVGIYGYYGRYYGRGDDEFPVSDPLGYPAREMPPVFLIHGTHDNYVPVEAARVLVAHLRAESRSAVAYAELPGAQHGFDVFASQRFRAVLAGIEAFLDREVLRRTQG